jgi:hypothetical protein
MPNSIVKSPWENCRGVRSQVIVERVRVADRIALRNIPQRRATVNRTSRTDKDFS